MYEEDKKTVLSPSEDGSYHFYKTDFRVFYVLLSAFVFTVAALYFYKNGNTTVSTIFFVSFVISAVLSLKLVLLKKTVMLVEDDHIIIYPIIGDPETILWDDIKGFKEIRNKNDHYIAVYVNDPETVVESQTNKLTYKIMRQYYKTYNTPFLVPSKSLNAHSKEIIVLLNEKLSEYYNKGMI